MNAASKVWESESLIRFPDCDPFNHLNNARYIDYFINAREDHIMLNMKMNIYQFAAAHGLGWVVSKNQIVYLKPAFLMETVVIDSTILKLEEKSLLVEMKMWNEKKEKLKSVLWSEFVHINMKTQKPAAHTEELLQTFRPFENPLLSPMGFDERVDQLRNQ
jgi:YbgC/YbaW family acyl-CoA thioester hydrolase